MAKLFAMKNYQEPDKFLTTISISVWALFLQITLLTFILRNSIDLNACRHLLDYSELREEQKFVQLIVCYINFKTLRNISIEMH